MDNLYWVLEYGKVLLAYLLLMFALPAVLFRGFLRGKSIIDRFSFCTLVQPLILNAIVLGLGLLHVLTREVVTAVFAAAIFCSLWKNGQTLKRIFFLFRRIVSGRYGFRLFLLRAATKLKRGLKRLAARVWHRVRPSWLEYLMLAAVLVFGAVYFTYGAFQDHSYGFGDLYVHHGWIYELTQGKIFADGIYPYAMHCLCYCMYALFGIRIYSILLFLAGIHVMVTLAAMYCLMREIFHWRFTPIFVLVLFLVTDLKCIDEIFSMSRLQWTLPQEFGLYAQFLCVLYLMRYLKSSNGFFQSQKQPKHLLQEQRDPKHLPQNQKGPRHLAQSSEPVKFCWDENLLLFAMSLASSLAIHFYTTMMAFFLCFAVALLSLHRVFCKKRFVPLVTAVVCAVAVAAAPMVGALAEGYSFQGSIGWAMNVIRGTDTAEGRTAQIKKQNSSMAESSLQADSGSKSPAQPKVSPSVSGSAVQKPSHGNVLQTMKSFFFGAGGWLLQKAKGVYTFGYLQLYGNVRGKWIALATLAAAALWCLCRFAALLARRLFHAAGVKKGCFGWYPSLILASVLFMLLYSAPYLGLPELIAGSRLCSTGNLLILAVVAIPADMLFSLLALPFRRPKPKFLQAASLAVCAAIYLMSRSFGFFHSYLYYELTRYNAAVQVTNQIIAEYPQNSYTLVSCTDELYQVVQYGRHEELLNFLNSSAQSERYTLPTKYVFLYVEKKPLAYAQNNFFSGPPWLAGENYRKLYSGHVSQYPKVDASAISLAEARKALVIPGQVSKVYSQSRVILESRLYDWCQNFKKLYPHEMQMYYEDDDFLCYLVQQNPDSLYNLSIRTDY